MKNKIVARIAWFAGFLMIGAVLFSLINVFLWGSYVATESIIVENMTFDEYFMEINGNTNNSALAYSGYKLHREGNMLYIQLRYSLANKIRSSGRFEITDSGPFEGINVVYLQGHKKEDKRLIWKLQ